MRHPWPSGPRGQMLVIFALASTLVILVVGLSFFADYKWRRWMAERRRDRD